MSNEKVSLIKIAKTFLTIGTIGFGGGMAIIALMQDYFVNRKKLLSTEEFSHGVALGQFLGPFAVNTAIFIGYRLRGLIGGFISVISFLLPSIVFVIILSAIYVHYQKIPSLQLALQSIGPVVVALILYAAYQMGKEKTKSIEPFLLILMTIILFLYFKLPIIKILLIAILYAFIKVRFFQKGEE